MKIRFHRGDWCDDVKALEAVRARISDRMELMVDCNQGWRMPWDTAPAWTFEEARDVARALEPLSITWMEEPLHRANYDGMHALREATRIRIAGGEMAREVHELHTLIERDALDVLQPDAALVGGITGLKEIVTMAEAHGLIFTPHTWTNGMGLVANAHLAAGLANAPFLEFPYDPPEWSLARRDFMMTTPLRTDAQGWVVLGDTPGMGYELDEGMLAKTRIA